MKRNIRLKIAYDGSRYNGWQKQGNTDNTIQGKLEKLLFLMTGEEIEIHGSGRTDAGVHALAQIANFHTDSQMTTEEMKKYFAKYLPSDIAVLEVDEVKDRFHSRLNATRKCYEYRIWNSEIANVFERKYVYQIEERLDVDAMRRAAEAFVGTYDFAGFHSTKRMKKSTVRTIYSIEVMQIGEEIRIRYEGNGFLYNMVRILTGTLIEVGQGKRKPEDMQELILAQDRSKAGFTAPAHGLRLSYVSY